VLAGLPAPGRPVQGATKIEATNYPQTQKPTGHNAAST
jgi:hypothetical protein